MIYFNNFTTDPYFNLALEEFLTKSDFKEDICLLWQNNNTIVVGKNQNTFEEINIKEAKKNKVNIVRRISGGGAVYQDKGNLCYSFILNNIQNINKKFEDILTPIINALQKLGLNAKYGGKNDIEIDGMKVSGNAQWKYKNRLLHHGTLLFDVNLNNLSKYLNIDKTKIISKGIKSIKSRVTNIKPLLKNNIINIKDFLKYIKNELISKNTKILDLSTNIIKQVQILTNKKYKTWEWNFGYSPDFMFKNKIFYENKGIIDVRLNIKQGYIQNIKIYGDFLGSEGTEYLEHSLQNIKYDRQEIKKILSNFNIKNIFGNDFVVDEILDIFFK